MTTQKFTDISQELIATSRQLIIKFQDLETKNQELIIESQELIAKSQDEKSLAFKIKAIKHYKMGQIRTGKPLFERLRHIHLIHHF